ncbi:MAG: hypothetical protein Kow0074_03020 [Candidatus Zixiibacteriota bacterium]
MGVNQQAMDYSEQRRCLLGSRRALMITGLVTLLYVLVAAPAFTPSAASDDDSSTTALVVVNGDTIYTSDLDRLLISTHRSMEGMQRLEFDYEKLLSRLINDRLIVQEALAMGMDQDEYLTDKLTEQRQLLATRRWVQDNFERDLEIPDDSIQTYFRRHFNRVQLRVLTSRDSSELAAAREAIIKGAAMDSVAREISIDNYSAKGGLRSPTWHVELEPILRAYADSVAVGELSAVFPYRSVYAIARVESITPADTSELAIVRPQILSWLKGQANQRQWKAFLDRLRERYPVTIDSAMLDRVRADSSKLFTPVFSIGTKDPVMRIGDALTISETEFRSELAHGAMNAATTPFPELLQQALDRLEEKSILMAAASADGYMDHPDVQAAVNRARDSALVEIYLAETVSPRIVFSRAEFDEYYNEHPEEFRRPDRVRFDQMTVDSQATAMEIYERLQDGADFNYLGKKYGAEMPSTGELSDFVEVTTLPESIRREVDSLRIGECTRPQKTAHGWLILRVMGRKEGVPLPRDEVEARIRTIMYQQKFGEELDSVLAILKANSTIEYNNEAIEEYFGSGS